MIVADLKDKLADLPDDMEVMVNIEGTTQGIADVTTDKYFTDSDGWEYETEEQEVDVDIEVRDAYFELDIVDDKLVIDVSLD